MALFDSMLLTRAVGSPSLTEGSFCRCKIKFTRVALKFESHPVDSKRGGEWHTRLMDSSRRHTKLLATVVITWLIVTAFVWRDLKRRSPDQVRGSKWFWRLASTNLTGSIAYFVIGRKRSNNVQNGGAVANESRPF